MKTRVITAIVGIIVLIGVMFTFNTLIFNLVIAAITLIAIHEIYSALGFEKKDWLMYAVLVPYTLLVMTSNYQVMRRLVMPMSFLLVTFYAIYLVVRNGTISYQKASGLLMFSGIVIFCFYSFIRLKELLPVEQYGYDAVFFILLILCFAWGGDTCAYFAGRAFGKHKLCPVVSPKKTVEGAIGGVLGTMVFGVVATLIYSVAADRMEAFTRSNIGVSMYVIIALLGFGMIRLPLQNHILEQEKAEGLLDNPVELSSSDYLEQQLAMVSLGGLRSLVAALLSKEAFDCILISDWANLERRYNQVTALAPHSDFYWDNGSWHLGNNASSSYLDNKRLSPMERREGFRKYIQKGRRFLEKGINANPDSWYLQSLLGNMYSDTYRQPDFEKAAEAYRKARDLGAPPLTARKEFYALVRVPSKSGEALELGRELFKDPRNRTPSLVSNIFVLENRLNIPEKERIPFRELFPTDEIARDLMTSHLANSLKYPVDGLREALESLPPAKDE